MASDPPAASGPPPEVTDLPLPQAIEALLVHRKVTLSGLGSLLRAEGLTISRTRLHQLATGKGAAATVDQMERLASVLGVSPGHFAEYRLARARALLDPSVVGFERAMANLDRLRGRRESASRPGSAEQARDSSYPPATRRARGA